MPEHQHEKLQAEAIQEYLEKGVSYKFDNSQEAISFISAAGSPDKVSESFRYYAGPPDLWQLGMTKNFQRDVSQIDRKLQGQILEALTTLTKNPLQVIGNTMKPLTGKFKGFWRYRIGDYRMIYMPNEKSRSIDLIGFKNRGAAYG